MFINQILTKLKSLVYSKSETDSLLNGKASSSHTHTKSQITDFPSLATVATSGSYSDLSNKPTIPTNTNQLTNGAGFITSSGSCNYANYSGYVQGNNNSANAANALLRSGGGRGDSSPEGDTWIFLDEIGGASAPWGFKHNQLVNTIGFYGAGTETSSINLSNGHFSGTVDWSHVVNRPTNVSNFTNDSGYITSSGSCNYANSSGNADTLDGYHHDSFPKTSEALFTVNGLGSPGWSAIGTGTGGSCIQVKTTDNTYPSICFHRSGYSHCVLAESGGQLGTMQQGSETFNPLITSANIGSQSVNYANSAGNSDTLDGYHEYSFLRNRGSTSASGEGTLWAQIGIKQYNGALPDGLSGLYNWGEVVSLAGTSARFDIYCSHNSSNGNGLYYRSGWDNDKKDWRLFIDSANIGSQSVNYANSSGNADTLDGSHAWQMQTLASTGNTHGSNDWLMQCQYNVDGDGYFKLYCGNKSIGTKVDRASSAGWADSAGGVAWGNVSGRPWALSQFTNDSGFITSAIKESNYSDNANYCLLYGNLLIQFGSNVFEAQSGTITFKKSFSSMPIVVVNYGDDCGFSSPCCLDEAYKTYFTVTKYSTSSAWRVNWIAIGRA